MSRLVKTEKVVGGKVLKFVGIKQIISYLITSRLVLNTWQEFLARELLTARYRLFIMLHIYDSQELRRMIE